ncbi:MAG TPA: GGDEF domain-containing protein [Candidatus Limiplasma sp.]|nr:GGDEF domain-containing protein [Candidatus Limiplasma sp.]
MISVNNINYCDLLLFSVFLNLIMYFFLYRQKAIQSYSTKLYRSFILSVAIAGFFEVFSWIFADTDNTALIPLNYICNLLFFSCNILPVAMGLRYLDFLIFASKGKNKKRFYLYLIPVYVNLGFVLCNLVWDGLLFSIDSANVYHRGIGVYIGNVFAILFASAVIIGFFRNKQMITGRITQIILTLILLPVLGTVLQTLFYGLSLGIPAYTLALFITFLLMERCELQKDPLTLLNSRIQMESRLQYKLKSQEPFTAIMIDVDGFKHINDEYGHTTGDIVLKDVSKILLSGANYEDFVCRFGGDEFFVILESPQDIGQSYIRRIDQVLREYSARQPFATTLSYGAVYVDNSERYQVEDLIRTTDLLMYQNKLSRKQPCKL